MKVLATTSFIFGGRAISSGDEFDVPDGVAQHFIRNQFVVAVVEPEMEGPGMDDAGRTTAATDRDPIARHRDPRVRRTRGDGT